MILIYEPLSEHQRCVSDIGRNWSVFVQLCNCLELREFVRTLLVGFVRYLEQSVINSQSIINRMVFII